MSAMICERKGCETSCCETYIEGTGYVCDSCINEFREHVAINEPDITPSSLMTAGEIRDRLNAFLKTKKGDTIPYTIDEFFDKHRRKYE